MHDVRPEEDHEGYRLSGKQGDPQKLQQPPPLAPREAIVAAATRRLRPIMMTTLTTFLGLAPMILETSRQARFMIPMAISLGFGMLFATVILLVLVPCLYLSLENLRERLSAPPPPEPERANP